MAKDAVTIFHNPNCGTSRNVLAALRERESENLKVVRISEGRAGPGRNSRACSKP